MAVSERTLRPVINETNAVLMVIPAEGPSFGIAPAGSEGEHLLSQGNAYPGLQPV